MVSSTSQPCSRCGARHLGLLTLACAMIGCSSVVSPRRNLHATDFVDPAPNYTQGPTGPNAPETAGPPIPVMHLDNPIRMADAEATPGDPVLQPDAAPLDDGSPVLIDELVGEINGNPIFANEFLSVVEGTLRGLARKIEEEKGQPPTFQEWENQAGQVIAGEINRMIEEELVSAESYRQLTVPEQNLRRFIEALRSNQISLLGGSSAAADRTLQEERGLTTDELLEAKKDQAVFDAYFAQFHAGLNISMRDIKRYYRTHYDEFNPPPRAVFRWIRVSASNQEAIERIQRAIDSGTPFDVVGHDEANLFSPDKGGQRELTIEGELSEATLLNDPALNDVLIALQPGETAGPIERTSDVSWLQLVEVRRVSQSLYDAQLEIETKLRAQEVNRRLNLEIMRLRERAGITNEQVQSTVLRLLQIAVQRYAPGH